MTTSHTYNTEHKPAPHRCGLVLEGGGFRCMFTAGVTDVLMEQGLVPGGVVGVSAGAAFGCNIKSGQVGRALRYNLRFAHSWRYTSWASWLLTGNLVNARFAYHTVPTRHDIFDAQAFASSPVTFWLVCTDVDSGHPVYHRLDRVDHEALEWIRASASLPVVARIVRVGGHRLLDGGISDSIPLAFIQRQGFDRNIVVLTQPRSYRKQPSRAVSLACLWLRRHPNIRLALSRRHEMYNAQLDYVARQEALGHTLVIAPKEPLAIADITSDTAEMQRVYQLGRQAALSQIDHIRAFMSGEK